MTRLQDEKGQLLAASLWQHLLNDTPLQKIAILGDERISTLALAPDGKSFGISEGGWRHDAVLLKGLK